MTEAVKRNGLKDVQYVVMVIGIQVDIMRRELMTNDKSGTLENKDICPKCGKEGDSDSDGFYCPHCDTYFDVGDYRERWAELSDEPICDGSYAEEIDDGDGDPLMQEDEVILS